MEANRITKGSNNRPYTPSGLPNAALISMPVPFRQFPSERLPAMEMCQMGDHGGFRVLILPSSVWPSSPTMDAGEAVVAGD